MLDGNRYYADFPDEDPELRPRITAVLQALGKVERRPIGPVHWMVKGMLEPIKTDAAS